MTAKLFQKSYSGTVIHIRKAPVNLEIQGLSKKLRNFLIEYQDTFNSNGETLRFPDDIKTYLFFAKKYYHLEKDNIENIINFIFRSKKSPYLKRSKTQKTDKPNRTDKTENNPIKKLNSSPRIESVLDKVKVGTKVSHKMFGIGTVLSLNGNKIEINFVSGKKIFIFPEAFMRNLLAVL